MGELLTFSQSSLLLLSRSQLGFSRQGQHLASRHRLAPSAMASLPLFTSSTGMITFSASTHDKKHSWKNIAGVISDSKVPTTFTVDSAGEGVDILPDSGGSDDNLGGGASGNGGGGGGGGDNGKRDDESESDSGDHKKQGMLMSQKITLAYAALVGIGGLMGFLKGGSLKSLIAGGFSAALLYYVFTLLPSNPVMASSIGVVLSASLLGVMGSRFKRSGKIFPAGIVSFVSLVMTGGYLHGILRGMH